jgi:hypothetical protein
LKELQETKRVIILPSRRVIREFLESAGVESVSAKSIDESSGFRHARSDARSVANAAPLDRDPS